MSQNLVCYDKYFLAKQPFKYKNNIVYGVALLFCYHYFVKKEDGTTEEVYFSDKNLPPQCYVCSYDKKHGYAMKINEQILRSKDFTCVTYELHSASISVGSSFDDVLTDSIDIPCNEAILMLKEHPEMFDTSTNVSCQSMAYSLIDKIEE